MLLSFDFSDPRYWIIVSVILIIIVLIGIMTKTLTEKPRP